MRTEPQARDGFTHIHDLFSAFGPVAIRRMFGGAGIYAEGVMFGLIADGVLHLKADSATQAGFEREGCGPFTYEAKDGRRTVMSYWRLPERLLEDPDELAEWARTALAVARRAAHERPKRRSRRAP
jgi:DNA transformation protein and related proteins